MVMAFLFHANLIFEPQNIGTIFAKRAVHRRIPTKDILCPIGKNLKNQGVVIEIRCFQEFYFRVSLCNKVSKPIYSINQNTPKQEIWENDHLLISKFGYMFKTRLNQGEGYP